MKKLILIAILSLGAISCEQKKAQLKNEHSAHLF